MADVISNGEHDSRSDLTDVDKILRLAEELQTKAEAAGPRVLIARSLFGLATVISVFILPSKVGFIIYHATGAVLPLSTVLIGILILIAAPFWYFTEHFLITRVHRQVKRDQRALSQAVTLLQELQSTLVQEHQWSALDQALFKIRMARFDVEAPKTDLPKRRAVIQDDSEQRFSLIDSLVDDSSNQWVIFMHEHAKDVPRYIPYVYQHNDGSAGTGLFETGVNGKLDRVGLVRSVGSGRFINLTTEGHRYAEWLLARGRKSEFFWTPVGGWGDVSPSSPAGKWREKAVTQAKNTYHVPIFEFSEPPSTTTSS